MKKISISIGQEIITGTLHFPQELKEKNPSIIFIHGWTSNEDGYQPRAKALSDAGYICLTINLRGHGTSSGELEGYSREDHLEDSIAAYDFLTAQTNIDRGNISIVGASYGAYLGAMLANKREIKCLGMRAPALYINDEFDIPTAQLINNKESEFFQHMEVEENNFALSGVKKVESVLLIESEFDQIIPHRIIELYKKEISDVTHKIIKGADHQLSKEEWKKEFIDILIEWFSAQ